MMVNIKYLLVEDEHFASEEIRRMMALLRPAYLLQGVVESVGDAVAALQNSLPDLMIVDIQLSDGLCFEVFERMPVNVPVIFTTAYDEYALQAFRVNSIDYLLKPVEEHELERALRKFEANHLVSSLSEKYNSLAASYLHHVRKNRFLVSVGDALYSIETSEIAFFYAEEKYVFLHTFADRRYIVGYSLEQLEPMLDPQLFFRVSRNCIAHIRSIKKVSRFFGSRLLVRFSPPCPQEVIVSRNRTGDFLKWMDDAR